jgi:hypothetical protein
MHTSARCTLPSAIARAHTRVLAEVDEALPTATTEAKRRAVAIAERYLADAGDGSLRTINDAVRFGVAAARRITPLILLAVLLLSGSGCTRPLRQINVGAPVPLYFGSPTAVADEYVARGGVRPAFPRILTGWTDRERVECAVAWCPNPDQRAGEWGWLLNEFCHLIDLTGGDHWKAAYLISGSNLNALCDDMPADATAAVLALREARRRAKAEGLSVEVQGVRK